MGVRDLIGNRPFLRGEAASHRRSLHRDERGAYLILFALSLPVLLAVFALALETGRIFLLNTQLQNAVDAAASGAASRLDGSAGAILAARAASASLDNRATASSFQGKMGQVITLRFAASLADLDSGHWLDDKDGTEARWVAAEVAPQYLSFSLARLIGAFVARVALSAHAVASSRFVACQVTPLLLCHPSPGAPLRFHRGAMYRLPLKTRSGALSPGDLVALDPPMTDAAPPMEGFVKRLAGQSPRFCFTANDRPRVASAAAVADALNIRFDIYPTDMTDLASPPAPNTIKGLLLQLAAGHDDKSCHFVKSPEAAKLPRDACFDRATCIGSANGFAQGDASWARDDYWGKNHLGQIEPDNFSTFSRYETYLLELGIDPAGRAAGAGTVDAYAPNGPERLLGDGTQSCAARKGVSEIGRYDRRVVEIAIKTCGDDVALDERVDLSGADFARFFLTEPMDGRDDGEGAALYLEFIEMLTPATDNGKLKQIVELVR